jgi:hypothetical protein
MPSLSATGASSPDPAPASDYKTDTVTVTGNGDGDCHSPRQHRLTQLEHIEVAGPAPFLMNLSRLGPGGKSLAGQSE